MQVGPLCAIADGSAILLLYLIAYTADVNTLNVRVRIRRGTGTGGTLLTTLTDSIATAGQLMERDGIFVDAPTTTAPQFYSLTLANITGGGAVGYTETQFFAMTL